MSAIACPTSNTRTIGCLPFLIASFLATMLIALAVSNLGVHLNGHAVERHGSEALIVRKCLDERGPFMVLKHRHDPIWYLVCQLDLDRFGVQVVTEDGQEKTAFIPGNGTLRAVRQYFEGWAVRYTKLLPWIE